MLVNDEKIEKFWQWFVKNDQLIKSCIERETASEREKLIEQLNNFILEFGMFTWDIGLDEHHNWFFTISPNIDPDLLEISQQIMSDAPAHLDWQFNASRPAKNWARTFSVYNNEMDLIHIDASSWFYIAFEENDGKIELVFEANNIAHLDEETAEQAVNLFLINEIGEYPLIVHISTVTIVNEIDLDDEDSKYPIHELREHLSIFLNQ